jgi:transcriptional regulator of acetoin/glycerol metabolism
MTNNQDSIDILRRLGQRRRRHLQEGERLAEAIRLALEVTQDDVSRTDAAHLLGLDRTTLYTVYLRDGK